ncbi:TetR/AcrR family transcriptional regulator [Microbacterium sp. SORGH_AS_0888]|uniref:TetR/AcrR family transcriptional regulator n=1 Tax=Microbacterium sp. SORGH_AS_0888 TaxID=3041791 RepID=UPI00278390BB|nr:TetR/AcrR family transcriptional regulator [Microbacterium sp. SORGH_AS_0888]MDQ1128006.1 AcrR family transcriptional regulator [Microbacterium sp. SORGH_AS_0888]
MIETPDAATAARGRAAPMPPDERRAMIAGAAVPLLLEHGSSLTTRQLAEHLGIAEGTIFRAFGDKESLIREAVRTFFTQARERRQAEVPDASLPLPEKVARLVHGSRQWGSEAFRMLSLVPREEAPRFFSRGDDEEYRRAVAAVFASDAARLRIAPERMASIMRMAGVAASAVHQGGAGALSEEELVQFILYGVAGEPRGGDATCSADS